MSLHQYIEDNILPSGWVEHSTKVLSACILETILLFGEYLTPQWSAVNFHQLQNDVLSITASLNA